MARVRNQDAEHAELALEVLSWIALSPRQLTIMELQYAVAIELASSCLDYNNITHETDLVSVCGGLVTIDVDSKIVRLIHYTTQEYFHAHWLKHFPSAKALICRKLLKYLCHEDLKVGSIRDQTYAFVDFHAYASLHWGIYAEQSTDVKDDEYMPFLMDSDRVNASGRILLNAKVYELLKPRAWKPRYTALHLTAFFGLAGPTKMLIALGNSINVKDHAGRTPLSWAAAQGSNIVAGLLMSAGADIEHVDGFGRTPLSLAAEGNHPEIVSALVAAHAVIDHCDNQMRTALSWAAMRGCSQVVTELMDARAIIDWSDRLGKTPLGRAAEEGHSGVAALLIAKGADIDHRDKFGRTALGCAVDGGHHEVLRVLIDAGAEYDMPDRMNGMTTLSMAVGSGQKDVVKALIDAGASLDMPDPWGFSAIHVAACVGHLEIANMLLSAGVAVDRKTADGLTVVDLAIRAHVPGMISTLLAAGALAGKAESGCGAMSERLFCASYQGNETAVGSLLNIGTCSNRSSREGYSPIGAALLCGQLGNVELLLAAGANFDNWDNDKSVAPPIFMGSSLDNVFETVLVSMAQSTGDYQLGRTPSEMATLLGYVNIARFLKEHASIEREAKHKRRLSLTDFSQCQRQPKRIAIKDLLSTDIWLG